jgi:hypothetical protein
LWSGCPDLERGQILYVLASSSPNYVSSYADILQMIGKYKALWASPRNLQIIVMKRLS